MKKTMAVWLVLAVLGGICYLFRMKAPACLAVLSGLLVVVTSFAFVLLVSSPGWNNPGESLSFLFAALIAALAFYKVVASLGEVFCREYEAVTREDFHAVDISIDCGSF